MITYDLYMAIPVTTVLLYLLRTFGRGAPWLFRAMCDLELRNTKQLNKQQTHQQRLSLRHVLDHIYAMPIARLDML